MPTVYLPLGSDQAFGQMGEMIVYQGQWVRRYVVPNDPRTDAQLDVRKLFHDITKTVKAAGPWARGAWRSFIGARWYTTIYQAVRVAMFNTVPNWGMSGDELWESMTEQEQADWNAAAPFQATYNEPGRVFWNTYFGIFQLTWDKYEYPIYEDTFPDPPSEWWAKTLAGVATAGKYDNFEVPGWGEQNWTTENDASAYEGSYKSGNNNPLAAFGGYFYGRKVTLIYRRGYSAGSLQLVWDSSNLYTLVQGGDPGEYQVEWSTPLLNKGLHFFQGSGISYPLVNVDAVKIS